MQPVCIADELLMLELTDEEMLLGIDDEIELLLLEEAMLLEAGHCTVVCVV